MLKTTGRVAVRALALIAIGAATLGLMVWASHHFSIQPLQKPRATVSGPRTDAAESLASVTLPPLPAPPAAASPATPHPGAAASAPHDRVSQPSRALPAGNLPPTAKKALRIIVSTSDTLRPWKYLGADPAGIPLASQIPHLPVPPAVQDQWLRQIRDDRPDTVWVKRGDVLAGITNGGRVSDTFKVWGPTVCAWQNRKTGVPIDSTRALRWPTIADEREQFTILQFLACTNAGYYRTAIPQAELPPQPAPAQPVPVPARPRLPEIPPFEPGGRELVTNGTVWMTGEYVDGLNDGEHLNGFAGAEIVVRDSYGGHRAGFVARTSIGALGAPNANGEFADGGGQVRLGARAALFKPTMWRMDVEAGGYGDVQKLQWRDERQVTPTQLHWEDRRSTVGDLGGYARTLGSGPYWIDWDVRAATGKRLASEVEARAAIEPRPITVGAAFQRSHYRDREVESHGRDHTFPESVMRMEEVSLGIRPRSNHRFSVGIKHWNYQSPTWKFDWRGPFAEYDWKADVRWRLRAGITSFSNTEDRDLRTNTTYDNDHIRATTGLNYDF